MGASALTLKARPARALAHGKGRPGSGPGACVAAVLALAALLSAACGDARTQLARGRLEVPVAALDLGPVPLFNVRGQGVEVRNAGRAPVTLLSVAVEERDGSPGAFTVAGAPASLEAGQTAQIEVCFKPEAFADYAAILAIASDDPLSPAVEVALRGRGSGVAAVQADPVVDFGKVCEGSQAVGWLALHSIGNADLIFEAIRFADGTAPEFAFASSVKPGSIVPVGGSLSLPLRFSPTAKTGATAAGAVVLATTDPAHRSLEVPISARVDRVPRAAIADLAEAAPGATIALDGSASADPDGDLPLTYAWSLKASPIGSASQPAPLDAARASMGLDLPGGYKVALVVRDAAGCISAPAYKEVLARPAQKLLVELTWDNPLTDLDLHLAPEDQDFFGPADCYFGEGHMRPDWGALGDPADDPSLDRDALVGFGPEIISYAAPAAGRYKAMVELFAVHGAKNPATAATIRVFALGVVKAELKRTLSAAREQWPALTIDWPSGKVTEAP